MSSSIPMHDQMSEKFIKTDKLKTPRVKFTLKKTPISKSINGNLASLSSTEDINGNLQSTNEKSTKTNSHVHIQKNQYNKRFGFGFGSGSDDILVDRFNINNKNSINHDIKKRKGSDKKNASRKKILPSTELKYEERLNVNCNGNGSSSLTLVPSKKLKKQPPEEENVDDDIMMIKTKDKKLDANEKNAYKMINKMGITEESMPLYMMKKTILNISDLIGKIEEKGDVESIKEEFKEYQMNLKDMKEIAKNEKDKNIVLIDILQANDMGINPIEYMRNNSNRYIELCEDMTEKKQKNELFKKFSDQLKASAQAMYPEDFKTYYENKGKNLNK